MASVDAEANVCRTPETGDKDKTTFCFFSLNNPKEFDELKKQYQAKDVEIKEFYGTGSAGTADSASKSVEKQFKNMLKSGECDSLVISGHHTGYFAGKQSVDKSSDSQILDLDFMEEMSCEEGCDEWFSNVKSLFLMGCQTVKTPTRLENDSDSPDSETIRIVTGNATPTSAGYIHEIVNQAYSSTLDQNNKLSHRYLRMFPNSSLYGWGEKSPSAGSEHSLPDFIDLVGSMEETPRSITRPVLTEEDKTKNILTFIDFMNSQDHVCTQYAAGKWAKHWISRSDEVSDKGIFQITQATACYLKDQTQFVDHQKLGCALTSALKSKNGGKIKTAVDNILTSGPEGIRANFNRLMSLVTNKENKKQSWYTNGTDNDETTVLGKLKTNESLIKPVLMEDINSDKVGFTRKSDYLYFYRKMGWGDSDEHKRISTAFLTQLQTAFDKIEEPIKVKNKDNQIVKRSVRDEVKGAHRWVVFNSIAQNGLGKWLHQNNEEEFENLQKKFTGSAGEWDPLYGHYLTYLGDPTPEEVETSDRFLVDFMNARPELNNYITGELCNNYGVSNSKEFVCQ